ncbi:MAG: rane protein [Rariglobus sp.]|jgi:putative membrane protein|nr:rane protein [Rariglobus sp.]
MNKSFFALLVRWSVLALGVTIATKIIPGIHYDTLGTLMVVVVLLSLFNAVLKPLLVLFSLPFIVLTLGLGILLINALLFMLVGKIVQGFVVDGFWHALGGALIVSLTNIVVSTLIGKKPGPPGPGAGRGGPVSSGPRKIKADDVIDI